jgi:hypothetical protein
MYFKVSTSESMLNPRRLSVGGKVMRRTESTETSERVRRLLTRAYSRAALPYLVLGLLLIVAIVAGGREIEHHINAIESWITNLGPWGVLAFVGLFVLATSLMLPDTVLCIIAGALFGMDRGILAVLVGSMLAGAIQFALSRRLLRARIQRMLSAKPSLAAIQRAVLGDEFRLQILLRLTPLNPATISYLLVRISHRVSSRGGAEARGYKARDGGPRRHTQQYVEEPDRAERSRHGALCRRSRNLVRNAD